MANSEGEYRVGISFNPSKKLTAEAIDYVLLNCTDIRTGALAATAFEDAAMWAVKSITKSMK